MEQAKGSPLTGVANFKAQCAEVLKKIEEVEACTKQLVETRRVHMKAEKGFIDMIYKDEPTSVRKDAYKKAGIPEHEQDVERFAAEMKILETKQNIEILAQLKKFCVFAGMFDMFVEELKALVEATEEKRAKGILLET